MIQMETLQGRVNCQTQDISFLTVIKQLQYIYVSLYSIPICGQTANLNFSAVSNHESLCILPETSALNC